MLAFQPQLLNAVERIACSALTAWIKTRCGGGQPGGVLVRHRFGGSLNLHIHGHFLLTDGVYVDNGDGVLVFRAAPPVEHEELTELAASIRARIMKLVKRRGLLATDGVNNEAPQLDAPGACANVALSKGRRERRGPALGLVDEDEVEHPRGGVVANVDGLNLYASGVVDGNDRERLELLCRYLLRGPFSQQRLTQLPDGNLSYRMKKPDKRGNSVMVLTPVEFLMRLCSLIPAPRHPTRKYLGIFAAGARDRARVVPKPTRRRTKHAHDDAGSTANAPVASPVKWAELLKRVWNLDALECPRCHGRMTPMAVVENREEALRYLSHTGDLTVHSRARAPPVWDAA